MADTMTPNALKTPILTSLGDLTGMRVGVPVKGSEVVNRALDQLGVTDADDRVRGSRNANWLATQVLRRDGLIGEGDKRGYWSLTTEGVQALTGGTVPVPPPPVTSTSTELTLDELLSEDLPAPVASVIPVASVVPAPTSPASLWVGDTAGVAIYPTIPLDTYANDSYIKSLAIGKTSCFGGYDATAPVCGGCPISGSCLSHQIIHLAKVAATLRKRDADIEAKANRITNTANTVSDPTRTAPKGDEDLDDLIKDLEASTPPAPVAPSNGVKMTAQVESRCFVCRTTISKGSTVFHVPNSGVRHESCK